MTAGRASVGGHGERRGAGLGQCSGMSLATASQRHKGLARLTEVWIRVDAGSMGARPSRADTLERALSRAREVVAGEVSGDIPVFNAAWQIRAELDQFGWKGPRFQQFELSGNQFDAVTRFLRTWRASGPEATVEIEAACRALLAGN